MAEQVNLEDVEQYVLDEIESYRYEVPEGALGHPFPSEKVDRLLAEMREALVKPEWRVVALRDTFDEVQADIPELRRCILVADDRDGYQLYYDPHAEDFVLAMGDPPETIGVRGDAVGCFMAR